MVEEIKPPKGLQEETPPEKPDITLTIVLKRDGKLDVRGPGNGQVYDEPLCLFLLYKAWKFIEGTNQSVMASKLVVPGHGDKPRIKDMFRNFFRRR